MRKFKSNIKRGLNALVFSSIIVVSSWASASWLGLMGHAKKEDPCLLRFLQHYDHQFVSNANFKHYRSIFVAGYNLLCQEYVFPLSLQQKTKMLQAVDDDFIKFLDNAKLKKQKISIYNATQHALTVLYNQLDPHTEWLTPEQARSLKNTIKGEYKGIGLMLSATAANKGAKIRIVKVIPKSPADRAGVKDGDIIETINGKAYTFAQWKAALQALKGDKNHIVSFSVLRNKRVIKFHVCAKKLNVPTVSCKIINQKYAYIAIGEFGYSTPSEMRKVLESKQVHNCNGIILDLRFNPGGLLYSGLAVADMFVSRALLVSVKGRDKKNDKLYFAGKDTIVKPITKVVVLVNNMTASAAEIVSAALQQNSRAVVIGQTTFGKGSVQNVLPLQDEGLAKITIQLFYTPNNEALQGQGVVPDIQVIPIVKNSFFKFHENLYKRSIVVSHTHNYKPKLVFNAVKELAGKKNEDSDIGCATMYLDGRLKFNKSE